MVFKVRFLSKVFKHKRKNIFPYLDSIKVMLRLRLSLKIIKIKQSSYKNKYKDKSKARGKNFVESSC